MNILAAATFAIATPQGPALVPIDAVAPPVARTVEAPASPKKPRCLARSRAFNYISQALDIATTAAAIDKGAVEANPILTPIIGKRPSVGEMLLVKAVPIIGIRLFDEHLVRKGRYKHACALNIGAGIPGLVAAGLNTRFVF